MGRVPTTEHVYTCLRVWFISTTITAFTPWRLYRLRPRPRTTPLPTPLLYFLPPALRFSNYHTPPLAFPLLPLCVRAWRGADATCRAWTAAAARRGYRGRPAYLLFYIARWFWTAWHPVRAAVLLPTTPTTAHACAAHFARCRHRHILTCRTQFSPGSSDARRQSRCFFRARGVDAHHCHLLTAFPRAHLLPTTYNATTCLYARACLSPVRTRHTATIPHL